ncbi:putative Actin-binding protein [Blattamonas nauphoetae]|uniref:Actin-binding protein n=1 Tax=Blattamonas nauphoetae TaxID=2049346 RepID=A0ABQ9XTI8_9EUKA|nr:putative Actin-binding protein [Blattamonas nauphoetae]
MSANVDLNFLESFVFADSGASRSKSLDLLAPNSEALFYYSILHEQLLSPSKETDKEKQLLETFSSLFSGNSPTFKLLSLRRKLLSFDGDEQKKKEETIRFIRDDILRLTFTHQPPSSGTAQRTSMGEELKSKVDTEKLSLQSYIKQNNTTIQTLTELQPLGKYKYYDLDHSEEDLLRLLNSLPSSSHPLAMDLARRVFGKSKQFNRISLSLTLDQLEQLRNEFPDIIQDQAFVRQFLRRLVPSSEVDLEFDVEAQTEYYNKLWDFAQLLPVALNSTKLALMYCCLDFDWKHERADRTRFMEYIKIPQSINIFVHLEKVEVFTMLDQIVRQNNIHLKFFIGSSISIDTLVTNYLLHFLAEAADTSEFGHFIEKNHLRRVFIQAKALNGRIDEVTLSQDDNTFLAELKDRVDLTFNDTNKILFKSEDKVELKVFVKNVKKMQMKVYEMNTFMFFTKEKKAISLNVDLDGISPSFERELDFSTIAPVVRHTETLPLSELDGKRGVFVVDLIGSGRTSRALIKKGTLRVLPRMTVNGHALTLLDENNNIVKRDHAAVWVDGVKYTRSSSENEEMKNELFPDEILVGFATGKDNYSKEIVLCDTSDDFCALSSFNYQIERYQFACSFFVDREELVQDSTAHVIIRPTLTCNGQRASMTLLENVIVTIVTTTGDGVPTTKQFDEVVFEDNELTTLDVAIGDDLASLTIEVQARVKVLSDLERAETFSESRTFSVNEINRSKSVVSCLLLRVPDEGYKLSLVGKAGEPISHQPVDLSFSWREVRRNNVISQRVITNEEGHVDLGKLEGISEMNALFRFGSDIHSFPFGIDSNEQGNDNDWQDDVTSNVVTVEGADTPIALPILESEKELIVLTELNSERAHIRHCSDFVEVRNGEVILSGDLTAGQYILFNWKTGSGINVTVIKSDHPLLGTTVVGEKTIGICERSATGIESVRQTENGDVKVTLLHQTPSTRVHVFCNTFQPTFDVQANLAHGFRGSDKTMEFTHDKSQFDSNKKLGTEQLYVLNRKAQPNGLGNNLLAPSILLNPIVNTETTRKEAEMAKKEEFSTRSSDIMPMMARKCMASDESDDRSYYMRRGAGLRPFDRRTTRDFNTLDWMANAPIIKTNLKVEKGSSEITVVNGSELKGHCVCTVVVTEEARTMARRITLSQPPAPSTEPDTKNKKEIRLMQPFDENQTFRETNTASIVLPSFVFENWPSVRNTSLLQQPYTTLARPSVRIDDMNTAKYEQFSSMPALFHLMTSVFGGFSINKDKNRLRKFEELFGNFGQLSGTDRVKRYSKLPCHETNLFFFQKDRELFSTAILPVLRSKKEKQVIDLFVTDTASENTLLDLVSPLTFSTLNALEQILVIEMLVNKLIEKKDAESAKRGQEYAKNFLRTVKHRVTATPLNKGTDDRLFEIALKAGLTKDESKEEEIEMESDSEDEDQGEDRTGFLATESLLRRQNKKDTFLNSYRDNLNAYDPTIEDSSCYEDDYDRLRPPSYQSRAVPDMAVGCVQSESAPKGSSSSFFSFGRQSSRKHKQSERMAPALARSAPTATIGASGIGQGDDARLLELITKAQKRVEMSKLTKFKQADETKEYRETQFLEEKGDTHALIQWNRFWCDYAFFLLEDAANGKRETSTPKRPPFVSANILDCYSSFASAACALAVSDLDLTTKSRLKIHVRSKEGRRTGDASGTVPGLLFVKEMKGEPANTSISTTQHTLLVEECVVDPSDAEIVDEDGERSRKYVSNLSLRPCVPYTADVMVTNTSSSAFEVDILLQIPQGAVPLENGFYTKTQHRKVERYSTEIVSYSFYFPFEGEFSHYPAQVMRKGKVMGVGNGIGDQGEGEKKRIVVKRGSDEDEKDEAAQTWVSLSLDPDENRLLHFLEHGNIFRADVNLMDICWRLSQKELFERVLLILERRNVYQREIWSYAFKHEGPTRAIKTYLTDEHHALDRIIAPIQFMDTPLYSNDPVERHAVNLYEYRPLVNARTFSVGTKREIANRNLSVQYTQFLTFLAHNGRGSVPKGQHPLLTADDKLIVSYYLVLQDRMDEAQKMFSLIGESFEKDKEKSGDEEMILQHAYMKGFLDFSEPWTENTKDASKHLLKARAVVAQFDGVAPRRWGEMFRDMKTQIGLIDAAFNKIEKPAESVHVDDEILVEDEARREEKRQRHAQGAQKLTTSLEVTLNKEKFEVSIAQSNGKADKATVKFYPIDIELLFSLNPFIRDSGEKCSVVNPSQRIEVEFGKEGNELKQTQVVAIPAELHNKNTIVGVDYENITKTVSLFDHSMDIAVYEHVGRLQVKDKKTHKPLSSVYVKTYSRESEAEKGDFLKDGFTDLTGSFDYASVNKESKNRGGSKTKFSILVMSKDRGSEVLEVNAPAE